MERPAVNDLDYLAARLHGRRSRMADGARLDALCRLTEIAELGQALYPESEFHSAKDLQRRVVEDFANELRSCLKHLEGPGAALLNWVLVRFQVENMKVLLRGFLAGTPRAVLQEYRLSLPEGLALDLEELLAASRLEDFVEKLPLGHPRKSLRKALSLYGEHPRPFFLEAALDQGYLQELLNRTEPLRDEDKELIRPIVLQEVDTFHLMLVVRGKFHHSLPAELLLPLHIRWSGIPSERFSAMLAEPDVLGAAALAVGRALDALPSERPTGESGGTLDPAVLERLAWQRFLRLANRAFRRSHMGLPAVFGYVGLRRVEIANLITLSEGIRMRVAVEALHSRLHSPGSLEIAHV